MSNDRELREMFDAAQRDIQLAECDIRCAVCAFKPECEGDCDSCERECVCPRCNGINDYFRWRGVVK